MQRLLGPSETLFWLMDRLAPMNLVVVQPLPREIDTAPLGCAGDFALPVLQLGRFDRPRWGPQSTQGVVERIEASGPDAWRSHAERLLQQPLARAHHPVYHAVLLQGEGARTLLLALHHALCDYRSALGIAHAFLRGANPGALMPACEDLLPEAAFAESEAMELLDFWWSDDAGRRWQAVGLEGLIRFLPAAVPTRLQTAHLDATACSALRQRCALEGVSVGNAVASAAIDALSSHCIHHAVDLARLIAPVPDGPGLAISHLRATAEGDRFWQRARSLRSELHQRLKAGEAAAQLLTLPRALQQGEAAPASGAAAVSLTGAPRSAAASDSARLPPGWVVASARAGGVVVNPVLCDAALTLVVGSPQPQAEPLAGRLAQRLEQALTMK